MGVYFTTKKPRDLASFGSEPKRVDKASLGAEIVSPDFVEGTSFQAKRRLESMAEDMVVKNP